jgi:ABC-2 type transport system permease protein
MTLEQHAPGIATPADPRAIPLRERWNRAGKRLHLRSEWRDLLEHRDLIRSLVHRDLTVRYKRSPLGVLWTLIHPLILMVIFAIIFSTIFRFQMRSFSIYFLSAFIAWTFFDQTVVQSMASLDWNGAMMKRIRVPQTVFAISTAIAGMINLGLSLIPLFIIMLVVGAPIPWTIVFLPIAALIVGAFALGTALALSALAVFFADVREMYKAISPALMYLTPIIYPLEIVPPQYLWMIKLNPLVYLVQLFRAPVYYAIIPTGLTILVAALCAAGALVIGWIVFRHLAPKFHAHL